MAVVKFFTGAAVLTVGEQLILDALVAGLSGHTVTATNVEADIATADVAVIGALRNGWVDTAGLRTTSKPLVVLGHTLAVSGLGMGSSHSLVSATTIMSSVANVAPDIPATYRGATGLTVHTANVGYRALGGITEAAPGDATVLLVRSGLVVGARWDQGDALTQTISGVSTAASWRAYISGIDDSTDNWNTAMQAIFVGIVAAAIAAGGSPAPNPTATVYPRAIPVGSTRTVYGFASITGDTIASVAVDGIPVGTAGTVNVTGIGTANVTWTCDYTPGGSPTDIGTENLSFRVTGGLGGTVVVTAACRLLPTNRQTLTPTAIAVTAGVTAIGGGAANAASLADASDTTGIVLGTGAITAASLPDHAAYTTGQGGSWFVDVRRTPGSSGTINATAQVVSHAGFTLDQVRDGSGTNVGSAAAFSLTRDEITTVEVVLTPAQMATLSPNDAAVRITRT